MRRFYASLAGLMLVASAGILFSFMSANTNAAARDCDNNAIIHCGAADGAELAKKYNENAPGDLPAIYQSYGLTAQDMTGGTAKMGEVRKDGTVAVNGEVVATDVTSIGRQNIFSGSKTKTIGGKTYYDTAPATSFKSNAISAFVFFDQNGQFKAFVLTSCGNPGGGKPKPKPAYKCTGLTAKKISRTEYDFTGSATATGGATVTGYVFDFGDGQKAESATPTAKHTYAKAGTYKITVTAMVKVGNETKPATGPECEKTITVEEEPAKPVYTCDSLTSTRISRTEHSFTGKATAAGGAEIVSYNFDFGDGSNQTVTNPSNVKHTYAKDGTYTAKLSVLVKVDGSEKTVVDETKCVVKVTVSPDECKPGIPVGDERCTPCPIPGKEQFPKNSPECQEVPAELPKTGPMDAIFSGIGLSSLIAAGGYYAASRRGLLGALLNQ